MAKHKEQEGGSERDRQERPIPYEKEQLSPRRSDAQDMPARERTTTPLEEAGERKGSTEGLAERDMD